MFNMSGERIEPLEEKEPLLGKEPLQGEIAGNTSHDHQSVGRKPDTTEEEGIVMRYWFLLENELVDGIRKGNKSLIPAALERVRFLKKVVKPKMLNEGVQGDEEALWGIYKFLHNNGWWDKAKNLKINPVEGDLVSNKSDSPLLDFIHANGHLIDSNVQPMVQEGNTEGIRIALNQIHYGSLKKPSIRRGKHGNKNYKKREFEVPEKNRNSRMGTTQIHNQLKIVQDFLQGYKILIEPSVYWDAMKGDDRALSLALGQIHHHSLPVSENPEYKLHSFKEALLKTPACNNSILNHQATTSKAGAQTKKKDLSVFFTNFDDNLHMKDLWSLFKKVGRFRDITLPRKRDKYGNRFGFVIVSEEMDGSNIISTLNGKLVGAKRLHLSWAKTSKAKSHLFSSGVRRATKFASQNKGPSSGGKPAKTMETGAEYTMDPKPATNNDTPPNNLEDGGSCEIKSSTPEQAVTMDLLPNEEMMELMNHTLFLRTVKPETVSNVTMIVEGLRVHEATIRALSSMCFLAHFDCLSDYEEVDIDFLQLGFQEVRKASIEDLLPARNAWLEVRGLPILGWKETNFKKLLEEYGQVKHCCRMVDDDGNYQTPTFLVETYQAEDIMAVKKIRIMNKTWKIHLIETGRHEGEVYDLDRDRWVAQNNAEQTPRSL